MNLSISKPFSVRFAGEAGQGNIMMGHVFANSLVKEGYNVVQTLHYGARVRGGLSYTDVLFDKVPIDFPKAETFDILYIMHDVAVSQVKHLKKNSLVFYDDEFVKKLPQTVSRKTKKVIKVPASKIAYNEIGNINVSNMVGLGILASVTGILGLDILISTMKENVKENYYEMDEKALNLGYEFTKKTYKIRSGEKVTKLGRNF